MMKKIACWAAALLLALGAAGCAAPATPAPEPGGYGWAPVEADTAYRGETGVAAEEGPAHAPEPPGSRAANYATVERLIVRNAWLDLVVPDTRAALGEIGDLVDELGGYIVDSETYQFQEGLRASVSMRVPAEKLDSALERIRGLATEVRSERVTGQDVTEEYVDLQSSLRSLEATEEKLLEFLDEAKDTEAALEVYRELVQIQAQIETIKGRKQYLEQSAAMATISLEITPDELAQPIQVGGWHPEGTLKSAVQSLVRVFQFLVDAAIVIVVLIAPTVAAVVVPFVGLFYLARAIIRRRRARKAE